MVVFTLDAIFMEVEYYCEYVRKSVTSARGHIIAYYDETRGGERFEYAVTDSEIRLTCNLERALKGNVNGI